MRRRARFRMLGGIGLMPVLVAALLPLRPHDFGVADAAGAGSAFAPDPLSQYLLLAAGDTSAEPVATLEEASSLLRSGQGRAARPLFEEAAARFPGFGDWALVLAAEAAAIVGDTAAISAFLASTEPELSRDWGWRAVAMGRRAAGDLEGAIQAAAVAAVTAADATVRAHAAYVAGRFALLDHDTAFAVRQLNIAIEAAPLSIRALDAARALSALPAAGARDYRAIGLLYLRHGNVQRGGASIDRYLELTGPEAPDRRELDVAVGRALFNAGRHRDAERRVAALSTDSDASIAAEASLILGRAQYRQGRTTEGRATLAGTVERFPTSRAAAEAAFLLGDLDHDDNDFEGARHWYAAAAKADPASPQAAEAAVRYAMLSRLVGEPESVAGVIGPVRAAHEGLDDGARLAYHAALALEAVGDSGGANQALADVARLAPVSYYASRASQLATGEDWLRSLPPGPTSADSARAHATGALRRIALLREIDFDSAADYEVERLKRHFDSDLRSLYALAEAFLTAGDPLASVLLGRDILRREGAWNERLLRIIYPFPHASLIMDEAERRNLDPFLVAGLIRQESLFQPEVRSSAGAIGMMQLMPATAREVATRERVQRPSTTTLRQPELNVRLGTRYLAELLDRYDGRLDFALAAYNAGPSRVTLWRRMAEADDPDLFAERIPFAQTRDYVRIVQQNAWIYTALYGN